MLQDKKSKNLLIIGNFNLPQIIGVDGLGYTLQYHEDYAMNSAFLTYLVENTLYQSIESPTRFADRQMPLLLDLVITDNPDQILSINHLLLIGASDHVCLLITLLLSAPSSDHICRIYINYEKICKELSRMQNGDCIVWMEKHCLSTSQASCLTIDLHIRGVGVCSLYRF